LENTCIVHISELLTGLHDMVPNPDNQDPIDYRPSGLPIFLLGGLGDRLKTGRHFDFRGGTSYLGVPGKYSHGELFLTLARAAGMDASMLPTFGEPEVCKRVISEILV